ncbi:aromatic hydrocarbon degradation membrane protein [Candidatus Magnetomorum sp. HK-1]|nr:aromatic hydrocarbon degradation membrane protein [Candidatus Magnetomorum sp. HK-1]
MMQKNLLMYVTFFSLMFTSIQTWGAGFALYENSSRGTAICGAFVAQADDPSALFYNPSGMTQLEGTHITNGINTYTGVLELHYANGGMESAKDKTWIVPNFYASKKLSNQLWVGLGVFAPFGLGNEFREDWYGRYNMYHTEIACAEVNPNVAFKYSDSLSFAMGISFQNFEILAKRKMSPKSLLILGGIPKEDYEKTFADYFDNLTDIDQEASLNKPQYRFNASFRYQANDKISFGGNYRSRVNYKLTGEAKYNNVPAPNTNDFMLDAALSQINNTVYNAKMSANISLPDLLALGVAFKVNDKLTVEADIVHTRWSRYDSIRYNFDNGLGTIAEEKNWKDVNCYRFGAEYKISDVLAARVGYLFDESPLDDKIIDYALPGNDRHLFTTGAGYKYKNYTIDFHYGLVICLDRDIQKNESMFIYEDWKLRKSYTHHLGFNVGYAY